MKITRAACLVLTVVTFLVSAMSSSAQDTPMGDVARAARAQKSQVPHASKVVTDEELGSQIGVAQTHDPAGHSQEIKSRRDAVGAARATLIESLLHTLFPGADVQWDPVLAIRTGSGPAEPVDLGDFTATSLEDGSISGVAMLETGSAKADHIEQLKKFLSSDIGNFETTVVAFRGAASDSNLEIKKVALDPSDPLTKIDWFEVLRDRPQGRWPVLRLRYESYAANGQAVAILEWDSLFNIGTGSFESRIPTGITVLHRNGQTRQGLFTVQRTGTKQIAIHDMSTGRTIDYGCGDPCMVDGRTFLAQISWQR